jgi:hypothetical protein
MAEPGCRRRASMVAVELGRWSWGLVELENFEAKGKRIRISLFVWLFVVCLPSRLVLCEARPPKSPPADDQSPPAD